MSAWLDKTIARIESAQPVGVQAFDDVKQASLSALKQTAWPTRKTEAWKYTSLYSLSEASFEGDLDTSTLIELPQFVEEESQQAQESIDLRFSKGAWQLPQSDLPSGLTIETLKAGATLPEQYAGLKPSKHLFGLLNDALIDDVLIIKVTSGVTVSPLIRLFVDQAIAAEQHARVFVCVAEKAELSVLEHLSGESKALTTLFAEYDIAASAKLNHYRFQLQASESFCVSGAHFSLQDHANLDSHLVGFGSELSRMDVDVEHAGEHAFAKMNAIYLLDGEQHFDLHTTIEHAVPNGMTDENVRGIVADQSQAVFNGRIHIHRDAQKTLAELNNRNLLLSRQAEINTKPELEIYADDVRCAHGATIAEIDQQALYYLTSRGINRDDALIMLNFGFINELVDQMPHAGVASWLRPILKQRFSTMKPAL